MKKKKIRKRSSFSGIGTKKKVTEKGRPWREKENHREEGRRDQDTHESRSSGDLKVKEKQGTLRGESESKSKGLRWRRITSEIIVAIIIGESASSGHNTYNRILAGEEEKGKSGQTMSHCAAEGYLGQEAGAVLDRGKNESFAKKGWGVFFLTKQEKKGEWCWQP